MDERKEIEKANKQYLEAWEELHKYIKEDCKKEQLE